MERYVLNIIKCQKDVYDRLIEDLNYHMLQNKTKIEQLYYVILNKNMIVIHTYDDSYWNRHTLNSLFRTIFKDRGAFIVNKFEGYRGLVGSLRSKRLNRSSSFFQQPIKTRRILREEMNLETRRQKILKLIKKYKHE